MKHLIYAIAVFMVVSCNNSSKESKVDPTSKKDTSASVNPLTRTWKDQFIALRQAIISDDRATVKSFFNFPINNEGNEIWYLGNPELVREMSSGKIVPFTERDFDKYYNTIISLELKKTLEQFDADELFRTQAGSSKEVSLVKDTKSKLEAKFDEQTNKLTLGVMTTGDEFEFAVFYEFNVLGDGSLKFNQVHVAG